MKKREKQTMMLAARERAIEAIKALLGTYCDWEAWILSTSPEAKARELAWAEVRSWLDTIAKVTELGLTKHEAWPYLPRLPDGKWRECCTTCAICRTYTRCAAPPGRDKPYAAWDEYGRPVAVCARCLTRGGEALERERGFAELLAYPYVELKQKAKQAIFQILDRGKSPSRSKPSSAAAPRRERTPRRSP